jgi:hypothetical protein
VKKFCVVVLTMLVFAGVSFCEQLKSNSNFNSNSNCNSNSNSGSNSTIRFGLGYARTNVDVPRFGMVDLDSVAARIWFTKNLGLDVSLGFKTGDASTAVLFGAKMIGNFIKINKLNIYWLGGLSVGSYDPKQNGVNSSTVFRIQGGVGAEYYLLNCLSVLTEMGLRFTSFSGNGKNVNDFGVYVDWLPQAGIRFYFN